MRYLAFPQSLHQSHTLRDASRISRPCGKMWRCVVERQVVRWEQDHTPPFKFEIQRSGKRCTQHAGVRPSLPCPFTHFIHMSHHPIRALHPRTRPRVASTSSGARHYARQVQIRFLDAPQTLRIALFRCTTFSPSLAHRRCPGCKESNGSVRRTGRVLGQGWFTTFKFSIWSSGKQCMCSWLNLTPQAILNMESRNHHSLANILHYPTCWCVPSSDARHDRFKCKFDFQTSREHCKPPLPTEYSA